MVKVSANGTVAACAAGDGFCGMVLSVGRGGDACAVALGGMVTAGYTVPAEGGPGPGLERPGRRRQRRRPGRTPDGRQLSGGGRGHQPPRP